MTDGTMTAAQLGFYGCLICHRVTECTTGDITARCSRCGALLHRRKPNSISRTWALLLTGYMLYIPANVLPVMHTGSLFTSQSDTIMSGIVYLWTSGSWYLAGIVFIASIFVPAAKLAILTFLVISVQRRSTWGRLDRTKMYRVVEFIGRWSMLDIFVVTILVALVRLQSLATISVGLGAVAFGTVVVLTMFASMQFDPRLIWDLQAEERSLQGNNDGHS
ncbi:MAG TPA: paraquat-inducible protein A [Nitrospira sp.]|nr:paraquat-inducible protein A [Nitrospira sp.]